VANKTLIFQWQMDNLLSRLRRISYNPCLISVQKDLSISSAKVTYKMDQTDDA